MKLTIKGKATAISPLVHIGNSDEKTSYAIAMDVPVVDDGVSTTKRIPFIQGSSLRGRLRDIMGEDIAVKVGGMLNLDTAQRLFSGGKLSADSFLNIAERRDILARCPDIALYGGIANVMFPSNVRVSSLIPICETTIKAGLVPRSYSGCAAPSQNEHGGDYFNAFEILRRNDEVLDGTPGFLENLSEKGLEEAEIHATEGMAVQAKKEALRKEGKSDKSIKKIILRHFSKVQVIPAGTPLFMEMHVLDVDKRELGLFLVMLRNYFKNPFVGGMSRSGYGKLGMDLTCEDENGVVSKFASVNDEGETVLADHDWIKDAISEYEAWGESADANSITVTQKAKSEKAEKKGKA